MARYRAIAADLAAKIRDGHYAPGEALPAQRELSAAYGVTLMTLRQALRELGAEGLIVQRPGKGTFVAPPHLAYQLGSLRSFADDLREQGHEVRTTVIARAQRRVPPRIAARLRVRETETGLRLERVRAFAGRRAIHQISWVREPHADRLRDVDFTTTSLYAALADVGVVVARASETIRPEVLDADVARHLDEDEGAPVLVSDRITYGPDGTALVADRATILGSMMQITADRAATGLSLHWGATPSHLLGASTVVRRWCMPEDGLSCGKGVSSCKWRLSSPAARRTASAVRGIYIADCRPLSLELSSCRRRRRAWLLSSHAAWSWKWRISQSSKHGLDTARLMPFERPCLTASSSPGWFLGHSTSNTHQNSSISASSSMALSRASMAMATSVLGTKPPCPVCIRRSTAATSRTDGFLLSALRYSGSVLSPSQNTTRVFRGFRVATFRLRVRAPAPFPLRLIILHRWSQDQARAVA